jgi:hypothetical protein
MLVMEEEGIAASLCLSPDFVERYVSNSKAAELLGEARCPRPPPPSLYSYLCRWPPADAN